MSVFTYATDGKRIPFDPIKMGRNCAGCILCGGRRIAMVGLFVPATDAMRAVVLRLRRHAPRARSTAGLAYGLCRSCAAYADATDRVEAALEAAAERIVVQ